MTTRRTAALFAIAILAGASTGHSSTFLLVISGLSGDDEYRSLFEEWSLALLDGAVEAGVPAERLIYLAEDPDRSPDRISAASSRQEVEAALNQIAERAGAQDDVWVVIFGHGSARGGEARINLPGPDMGAGDFARAVERIQPRNLVFINATSASGDFLAALSSPGRTVVTATRSAAERHAPVFGRYFVESLVGNRGDVDKDEQVSLLEAFDYARAEVERSYSDDGRMLTEHAMLDDNGDGSGSFEPSLEEGGDGLVSSRLFLFRDDVAVAAMPSELAALHQRKESLELQVAELRRQREALDVTVYQRELETVLLDLAETSESIWQMEGKGSVEEGRP